MRIRTVLSDVSSQDTVVGVTAADSEDQRTSVRMSDDTCLTDYTGGVKRRILSISVPVNRLHHNATALVWLRRKRYKKKLILYF